MKRIPLTQEKFAIVDDDDFDLLSKHRWYLSSSGYANRHPKMVGGVRKGKILMHRVIIGASPGEICDHINRNRLDNRKSNLRTVSYSQNTLNSKIRKNNSSGSTGVVWHRRDKKWQARISVNGKRVQIGYFDNYDDAREAYNERRVKFLG